MGIETRGEEAVLHAMANTPDIILLDINLRGAINGIEVATEIKKVKRVPIIYLTANSDEATFAKAKTTHPHAFISKPFNKLDLQRTIALVVEQLKAGDLDIVGTSENLEVLEDRIFVRHSGRMVKLLLDDILYIEADRNYSNIVTSKGEYLISTTLKVVENEIKSPIFIRVHRSYMVNITKLDVVADNHMEINRKVIPLSKSFKAHLLKHLNTI
jgi:DNA-binding LytR/AlgR family response regulator